MSVYGRCMYSYSMVTICVSPSMTQRMPVCLFFLSHLPCGHVESLNIFHHCMSTEYCESCSAYKRCDHNIAQINNQIDFNNHTLSFEVLLNLYGQWRARNRFSLSKNDFNV